MATALSIAFRSRGDPRLLLSSAKKAEAAGFLRIWLVEVYEADMLVLASALARATRRIGIASGVVNSYHRLPFLLAMGAATVSDLSEGRFALGIGAGSPPMSYASHLAKDTPMTRLRETVQIVRCLLAGESVNFDGELFRAENLKLGVVPRHKVRVCSAGMGIGTIRLAAQFADGVLMMIPTRHS